MVIMMLILMLLNAEDVDFGVARVKYCTYDEVVWWKSARLNETFGDDDDAEDVDEF